MPSEGCGVDLIGTDKVNPTACPRLSSVATVMNSPTASNCSPVLSTLVRRPEDDVTAAPCSSRATTSRTGRSPMLVTVAVTVTVGSLEVVTTSGVTLSTRSLRKSEPGSPAAVDGKGSSSSVNRLRTTPMIRGATATRSSTVTRPNRSRSFEGRRTPRRGRDGYVFGSGFGAAVAACWVAAAAVRMGRRLAAAR